MHYLFNIFNDATGNLPSHYETLLAFKVDIVGLDSNLSLFKFVHIFPKSLSPHNFLCSSCGPAEAAAAEGVCCRFFLYRATDLPHNNLFSHFWFYIRIELQLHQLSEFNSFGIVHPAKVQ